MLYLTGDDPNTRQILSDISLARLKKLIGNNKTVFIDEAQSIADIGVIIKRIIDNIKRVQVIATGSCSFELANQTNEPLTGRKFQYLLFPISFGEMVENHRYLEERQLLEHRMIYGAINLNLSPRKGTKRSIFSNFQVVT